MPQIFFEVKNVIFFGDFGQKTRTAGLIMLKLSTKMNQVFWEKNLENENFITAAIHRENWYFKKTNIFHYFPSKNLKYSQIFLSETIHAQENGSRGPHFAKSLNSNFLKGLTYSAVVHYWGSPEEQPLMSLWIEYTQPIQSLEYQTEVRRYRFFISIKNTQQLTLGPLSFNNNSENNLV